MARLGDVCKKASSNIAQKDLKGQAGSYPIYGAGGFIAGVNFYHREEPYIAVVKDGAGVGRVMKLPAKSSVIGTMQYILPNPGVDVGYLAYAMEHMNLGRYYTGTTIPHIYFKDYQREELTLPALSRQREMAAALDKLSDNMDLRRRQLAKLDELVKARFVEMFGDLGINPKMWSEIPLSSGCSSPDDIKCGPFGTQLNKEEYQATGIPLWGIPQINAHFQKPAIDFVSKSKARQLAAYSVIPGDIVMSRKGNVGMCALYPEYLEPGIIHSDVLRIRINQTMFHPVFLMCQLHISPKVSEQINVVSAGAIMAGINVSKLKHILLYRPPLKLQNDFAAFYERTEKQKLTIQQSLAKLEMIKKALMQEYFEDVKVNEL